MTTEKTTKTTADAEGKVLTTQTEVVERPDPPPTVIKTTVDEAGNTVQVRTTGDAAPAGDDYQTPDRARYRVVKTLRGGFRGRRFRGEPGDLVFLTPREAQILDGKVEAAAP